MLHAHFTDAVPSMHPGSCYMSHRYYAQLIGNVANLPPALCLPEGSPASLYLKRKWSTFPVHCHLTAHAHEHSEAQNCSICMMPAYTACMQAPAPQ